MKLRRILHLPLASTAVGVLLSALALDSRVGGATPRGEAAPASTAGQVLYPPAGAIVTSDPALIMILGPDQPEPLGFLLDGAPLDLQKMTFDEAWRALPEKIPAPAGSDTLPMRSPLLRDKEGKVIWVATAELPEGEHVITLDGADLARFSSRTPEDTDTGTSERPVLRVHASPDSRAEALDCARCHTADPQVPGESGALGVARTPDSCHSCHTDVDLSLSHEHVMEFLRNCQMCHDPHAATRASLLIDTRERVCGMCHESGYAR